MTSHTLKLLTIGENQVLTEDESANVYRFLQNAVSPKGRRRELESRFPMQHMNYYDVDTAIKVCEDYIALQNNRGKEKREIVLKTLLKIKEAQNDY